MKKIILTAIALLTLIYDSVAQTKFEFKYKEGDNFRILSSVDEDIFLNGALVQHSQITNRVSIQITGTDSQGRGLHEATFMTSENISRMGTTKLQAWGEEYQSKYTRDARGHFDIEDIYFMPVVRDVPYFPEHAVKIGDTWQSSGHEAHDMRRGFDIQKPFKVPFNATYRYIKDEEGITSDSSKTKKTFQVINVSYQLHYDSPVEIDYISAMGQELPVSTKGYSNQTIYWDNEKGQIDHYTETFKIVITTNFGREMTFKGTSKSEVTEFQRTATQELVDEVKEKIEELGIENVEVKKSEKGLTISIENIQFKPDSAILQNSEKDKLKLISEILKAYPDNDLLITGHTARIGSHESCQILSEERADSVAEYLIQLGTKERTKVFTMGSGERVPIATNSTEEGRAKNRRVEITILDK